MADQLPLPALPPVESHETYQRIIIDHNGRRVVLGGSEERSTLTDDGSVHHDRTDVRVMTLDGHVVDHEHGDTAHNCLLCGLGPYSRYAMTVCAACRHLICLACTTPTPAGVLCAACYKTFRRQAFWAFFRSIF